MNFRRYILFFLIMIIWGTVGDSQILKAQDSVYLDHNAINQATVDGIKGVSPGNYDIWLWLKDAENITVQICGQSFILKGNPKASETQYLWKKAGEVKIDNQGNTPFAIFTDQQDNLFDPQTVGYVALTQNKQWDPNRLFNLSRVFPNSAKPVDDQRLYTLRHNSQYFPFPHYESKHEWLERKQWLKDHILVSMGTYPLPDRTPLNAEVFGKIEREDYTVEKVYFESYPGFFVTGNLYKPKGKPGPFPAVLCPHGHWGPGRLVNTENNSIPGRCINFAKQGYICLAIDMIGYNDSKQVEHRWGDPEEWLWGISAHGLQFWNSVRAVDFLVSLPEVDSDRIGLTGASGGGTQTFTLMAVDRRIAAAAPVNMISAHFQGGCVCENAPLLRLDATNVEFGAMMAPRGLMMISATGDWTNETLRVEYPAVRSIYSLFDAKDHVDAIQIDAPHNYNQQSREAVYAAFGRWLLGNDNAEDFKEQDFEVEKEEDLRVFPNEMPDRALSRDALFESLKERSEQQLQEVFPANETKLRAMRRRLGTALEHVLYVKQPKQDNLEIERVDYINQSECIIEKVLIGRTGEGDQIPGILMIPKNYEQQKQGVLLVGANGRSDFFDIETGEPNSKLSALLERGHTVFMPDVFMTGEYHTAFTQAERKRDVSHFYTYNLSDTAQRVQDILTSMAYLDSRFEVEGIHLIGEGMAGLWSLLAAPFAQPLESVIVDANGFDTSDDANVLQYLFIPCLRRAGDFRAAQALMAPTPMMIHNTAETFDTLWARQAYATAGAADLLEVKSAPASIDVLNDWLTDIQ